MGDETMPLPVGTELVRTIRMARRLNAPPERVSRAWADPEELARWLPERVEGALAVGARTVLVWPDRRVWWEVVEARAGRSFAFRRPWLPDGRLVTTTRIMIEPAGYGTRLELEDGPFPLDQPGAVDAWAEALQSWTEALALLRAHLDFSVDLRTRT
jgi:uncharacterized protein YndB with AHSA1/START domain